MVHSTSDLYGASRIFLQTAMILKAEGAIPEVFLSEPGKLSDALTANGISVHFLRLGILRRKYINPSGILNRAFYTIRATLVLKKFIRENNIDLVYNNATSVLAGLFSANLCKVKHIWHVHEIISTPKLFAKLTAGWMKNRSQLNIFVSDATMDHWTSIEPGIAHLNKAVRIYNGLTLPEQPTDDKKSREDALKHFNLDIPGDKIVVGMIGRINPWKGQEYFTEIAKELVGQTKAIHFVMAGDPYPGYEYIKEHVHKKINSFGLDLHFTDLGFQENNVHFFSLIDLLIVPSILPDPLPTVVLEAMAYGKPVAGTAHGGIIEMISEGVTGYLIPPDDAKGAAKIILPLIGDRELRKRLGISGRAVVRNRFSPERFKSLILKAIKNTIDDQF